MRVLLNGTRISVFRQRLLQFYKLVKTGVYTEFLPLNELPLIKAHVFNAQTIYF